MNLPEKPFLTVSDVLPFFGVNEHTFRTWEKRKQLPERLVERIGHTLRIRRNILELYLNGELA